MSAAAQAWAARVRSRVSGITLLDVNVLLVMADRADAEGRGCWQSVPNLAHDVDAAPRSVRRSLARMLRLGVIRLGDQSAVWHIHPATRPVVYDLVMTGRLAAVRPPDPAVTPDPAVRGLPPDPAVPDPLTLRSPKPSTRTQDTTTAPPPDPAVTPDPAVRGSIAGQLPLGDDAPYVPPPPGWRDRPAREADVPLRRRGAV